MEINEKNYDYLKSQVKYAGFGENLDQELKEKMSGQQPEFTIAHQTKFGGDQVDSTLNFKKSKESELYFFNSFDMSLKQQQSTDVLKQTYYVGKENNLTLKERYNLLNDRAVFKEFNKLEKVGEGENARFKATDDTYKSWAVLNFKETDTNGNFLVQKIFWDHEKTLAKFPVKELDDEYNKSRLIGSLEKGNVQKATIIRDDQEMKVSIIANPRAKTFKFFDSNMQPLEVKQVQQQAENLKQGTGETQDAQKAVLKDDSPAAETTTNKRRQGMRVS